MIQCKQSIVSKTISMIMYLLKILFYSNWNWFTYHFVFFDHSKNRSKNKDYDLKLLIGEININETIQTKYYENGF